MYIRRPISKNMDYAIPQQRPHTVGSIPKVRVQSDVILKILQDIEKEARGPISKPKPPQKNHMKENLKRLKEIEAQTKQKIAEKKPLQPLKVPNKYCNVQSKITKNISCNEKQLITRKQPPKTAGPFRSQPPLSPCLSSKSERHSGLQAYRSLPQLNHTDDPDEDIESGRSDTDSERNTHSIAGCKKKLDAKTMACHRLGQIPTYLTQRKKQWELERERQAKLREEASIPHGYTLLQDDERIETLDLLIKNQEELIQSLAALPVRNDTIRLRTYKEELERQLAKVEEGIKIFSRPKVLIKNDT